MSVLRGPTDAANYRQPHGRYNDRWYVDPLPSCPLAESSDWSGPSWSIVKGAAGKDWSFVTNKRNAHTPRPELERIATLEPEQRAQAFNAINKNGLTQAGGRGTIVHLWAEDLLAGRSPRELSDVDLMALRLPTAAYTEALTYRDAIVAFFDTYQPEVISAEYVALHRTLNGVGYGCTPDVVARIQGQILGVDWKTRGIDSDHGAYPEEAAQIAAGARAEYMIIAGPDGNPTRATIPDMDGGIVVSIRPDGCRIYPVDLDKAFEHTQAMHAFWVARRTEKVAIGKPWAPKIAAVAPSAVEPAGGVDAAISTPPVDDTDENEEPCSDTTTSTSSPTQSTRPSTGTSASSTSTTSAPPQTTTTTSPTPSTTTTAPPDTFTIVADDGRRGKVTIRSSRTQLRDSLAKLIAAGHEPVIRTMWPAGVPPLSQPGHTVEQLTQLFYLVRRVQAEVGAPFDPEPAMPEPAPLLTATRTPQNGGPTVRQIRWEIRDGHDGAKWVHLLDGETGYESAPLIALVEDQRTAKFDGWTACAGGSRWARLHVHGDSILEVLGSLVPELAPALDDGAFLDPPEIELLKQRMLALPDHRIVQLGDIAREANDAGRPISVQQKPCIRRWEIARALVLWAEGPHDLDYLALTVSTYAQSLQIRGNDTIGAVISLYTIEQAVALADSFDHVEAA